MTFFTLKLVVAWWGLVTPLCLFIAHINVNDYREGSAYILQTSLLQLLAFFILSICFPNWQLNWVFYNVYVSGDKWHLCVTVMHVTSNILPMLFTSAVTSIPWHLFHFLNAGSFQIVSFWTVALRVDINEIFCFFKLLKLQHFTCCHKDMYHKKPISWIEGSSLKRLLLISL